MLNVGRVERILETSVQPRVVCAVLLKVKKCSIALSAVLMKVVLKESVSSQIFKRDFSVSSLFGGANAVYIRTKDTERLSDKLSDSRTNSGRGLHQESTEGRGFALQESYEVWIM